MAERRLRDFGCRGAVRIGDGTEGGIAERRGVDVADGVTGERMRVLRGQLHEEIVRMLRVDDRTAADRLAGLEQLRILLADRERLEAEHRPQHQMTAAERPVGHAHDPVRGEELVVAARAGLHDLIDEREAVQHQHPVAVLRHRHVHRRGGGFMLVPEAWRMRKSPATSGVRRRPESCWACPACPRARAIPASSPCRDPRGRTLRTPRPPSRRSASKTPSAS